MDLEIHQHFDIFILGAGPAGLSVLFTLKSNNFNNYLMIDFGKSLKEREKYDNEDAFLGTGGAGLYSDGKFSFYPCGTKVWELPDRNLLEKSYEILANLFWKSVNFRIPSFCKNSEEFKGKVNSFNLKEYPSFYLSFEERKKLINFLSSDDENDGKILMRHKLVGINKLEEEKYFITIEDLNNGKQRTFFSKFIVLGGGKYFPLLLQKIYKTPEIFRRVEFGARILSKNKGFSSLFVKDYEEKNLIDPKWVCPSKTPGIEYKTFCMCVDGEVILCKYNEIKGFSGRSDCDPTGYTNFGFNVIVRSAELIDIQRFLAKDGIEDFEITLKDALDDRMEILENIYGKNAGKIFKEGLKLFLGQFEIDINEIKVIGPTIEGVGNYPQINNDLSIVNNENIFVVGDATGIFRGIIPSMISGIYVALQILKKK